MAKKKKIALLTSGGDAPGMNAAIRSIVRNVINMDHVPIGITRGYQGLLNNEFLEMNINDLKSDSSVVFDVKGVLPKNQVDGRL